MGGYKNLLVYRLATTIYDGAVDFCENFLKEIRFRRLVEQIVHAARSGKQNIVEGSLEKSVESNIKLTGVGRASFGELLEDYKDFLRQRNLTQWNINDSCVIRLRQFKESIDSPTNLTNLSNWTNLDFSIPENFANLMVCLCYKQGYLTDQLLRSKQKTFVEKGGFRENLFKQREAFRKNKF